MNEDKAGESGGIQCRGDVGQGVHFPAGSPRLGEQKAT